jgi:hypothetical protein
MVNLEIDLGRQASDLETDVLGFGRWMMIAITCLGGLLFAAGVSFGLGDYSRIGLVSVAICVIMGGLLTGVGIYSFLTSTRAATRLRVDDDGIGLLRPSREWEKVTWRDYRNQVSLEDLRGVPPERRYPTQREIPYWLKVKGTFPLMASVSEEEAAAIVRSARSAGLTIRGWYATPANTPGIGRVSITRAATQ